mgnify:CR=1 FL=1
MGFRKRTSKRDDEMEWISGNWFNIQIPINDPFLDDLFRPVLKLGGKRKMKRVSTKREGEQKIYYGEEGKAGIRAEVVKRDEALCQYPDIFYDGSYFTEKVGKYHTRPADELHTRPCYSKSFVSPHHILGRRGAKLNDTRFIISLCQKHHSLVQGIRKERAKLLRWQMTRGFLKKEDLPQEWQREIE